MIALPTTKVVPPAKSCIINQSESRVLLMSMLALCLLVMYVIQASILNKNLRKFCRMQPTDHLVLNLCRYVFSVELVHLFFQLCFGTSGREAAEWFAILEM